MSPWTAPSYAEPVEEDSSDWTPPSYATPVEEEKPKEKQSLFSRIKETIAPTPPKESKGKDIELPAENAEDIPQFKQPALERAKEYLNYLDQNRARANEEPPVKQLEGSPIKRFGEGVIALPKSMFESVNRIGKESAEQLKKGDIHGAFKTITSPLMGPVDAINDMLEKVATGKAKDIQLPSQPEAKKEALSQIIGIAGVPGEEAIKAYEEGDYAKLAGMGLSAAAIAGLSHYVGGKIKAEDIQSKVKTETGQDIPIKKPQQREIKPVESANLPPDLVPVGEEEAYNKVRQPSAPPTIEDRQYDLARNKFNMGQEMPEAPIRQEPAPKYKFKNPFAKEEPIPEAKTEEPVKVGIEAEGWKPPEYAQPIEETRQPGDFPLFNAAKASPEDLAKINEFMGRGVSPEEIENIRQEAMKEKELPKFKSEIPEEATKPLSRSANWQAQLDELDKRGAPDYEYRDILSTGSRDTLKKGETWRKRVQKYIELSKKSENEQPSEMRVPVKGPSGLENIAVGGADPAVLDALSESLYTRKPEVIAAKELIQNAADELKQTGSKEPIRAATIYNDKNPQTGEESHSLLIGDSGRGLTPDQLYSVFTDVGQTGKADIESASGGFGFAKASPLLGGDYVEVKSVVNENGKKVQYSFEGNPTELKNQKKGVNLNKEVLGKDAKTGMRVKVYYNKENAALYQVERMIKNMGENSFDTPKISYHEGYAHNADKIGDWIAGKEPKDKYLREYFEKETKNYEPKEKPPLQDTIDLPNATVDVHYTPGDPDTSRTGYNLHIQNKGLWQQGVENRYGGYTTGPVQGVPSDIYVNIHSKIKEGQKGYPFGLNREALQEDPTYKAIRKWIDDNIVSGALTKQRDKLQRLYDAMPEIKTGEETARSTVFFDSGNRLTGVESNLFRFNPITKNLAKTVDSIIADALYAVKNPEWNKKLQRTGLFLGEEGHYGLHVPNPGAKEAESTIIVNPFAHAIDFKTKTQTDPMQMAHDTVITSLHEIAHIGSGPGKNIQPSEGQYEHPQFGEYIKGYHGQIQTQGGGNPGHETDWIQRLGDIYASYTPGQYEAAVKQIHGIVADPNTGGYNPEFQKLLQVYQESRGREATSEDFLSRTGVKQESPKGGEGSTSGGRKPNGEGTSREAVNELLTAMDEAKGKIGEQAEINKQERARRFSAFKSIREGGQAGAAKRLSKMSGEYEKVEPGGGLGISQESTDSLFDAIDRANITTAEKVRGTTALFKILNGESVPVASELKILDDVFGNGFGSKVTEMYGGIGAVGLKLNKLANTMKSLMYSGDVSFGLRQGLGYFGRKEWRAAMKDQFKYFAKPEILEAATKAIEEHPKYLQARESGLFMPKPQGGLLSGEEAFMEGYIGDLKPGLRSLFVKDLVDASERAYTGGLLKLRFDTFDKLTNLADAAGYKTIEKKLVKKGDKFVIDEDTGNVKSEEIPTQVSKNIAKVINVMTGRGSLGKLESINGYLNFIFGSPRMISSRLTALNPKFYMELDPFSRKEALKSLLSIAAGSTLLNGLAVAGGAKLGYNILSSDFAKTRFPSGNVLDPSGSFQQPIVATARMIAEINRMVSSGQEKRKYTDQSITDILGTFLTNKESPIFSLAHDLATANKFTGGGAYIDRYGNKKTVQGEAAKRFITIFGQDMYQIITSDPSFAELVGLPPLAAMGAGVQNYPEKKQNKSKFRKVRVK